MALVLGGWKTVISGMKTDLSRTPNESLNNFLLRRDWPLPLGANGRIVGDLVKHDLYSIACLMYCFLRAEFVTSATPIDFNWRSQRVQQLQHYNAIHLKHLVQVMLSDYAIDEQPLTIKELLSHPFFMTDGEMVALQYRMEAYNCTSRRMDPFIERYNAQIIGADFTVQLDETLLPALLTNRGFASYSSVVNLWHIMRNRR